MGPASGGHRNSASEGRGSSGSRRKEAFTGPQPLCSHTTGHSSRAQNAFCGPSANGPGRAVGVGAWGHGDHSTSLQLHQSLPDKEPEARPGLSTLGCAAQKAGAKATWAALSSTHTHPRMLPAQPPCLSLVLGMGHQDVAGAGGPRGLLQQPHTQAHAIRKPSAGSAPWHGPCTYTQGATALT